MLEKFLHFPKKWTFLDIFEVVFKALQVFSIHKQQPSTGALLNSFSENFEIETLRKNTSWRLFRRNSAKTTFSKFLEHVQAHYRWRTSGKKYLQNKACFLKGLSQESSFQGSLFFLLQEGSCIANKCVVFTYPK